MPTVVKILAKLWLLFFLITIVVIGVIFCVPFYFPLLGLSRLFPRWRGKEDQIIYTGIDLLMRVQPWFNADIQIELPKNHSGGILLVSNHRSHLDVFILLSRIPGIRVLAKSSLFHVPGLALMMRSTRQIAIGRGPQAWTAAMQEVGRRLRAGERVHIFPEMTRCPPGFLGLQHFAAAPFLLAMQEGAIVLPVIFKNTDAVWPKGRAGLAYRRPVEVRSLTPLKAAAFASARDLKAAVEGQLVGAFT